ncbi:MAG: hypothetical protein MUP61_05695, partial [Burkholderiales bacterium]|nr:hypothetical protein [Burkholderiales bacterium]
KSFADKNAEMRGIILKPPVATTASKIDERGALVVRGYFDTAPSRVFYELDQLYASAGAPAETRLTLLCKNQQTTDKRSDLVARQIRLFVQTGRYDEAIAMLEGRRFDTWEGGTGIHDTYVEAHTLRGLTLLKAGQAQEALHSFQAALDYPENLGVDRPAQDPPAARAHLFIAAAYEALNEPQKAAEHLDLAASTEVGASEFRYHKGQALAKLGKAAEAKALFDALASDGAAQIESGGTVDFFMKFGERQARGTRLAQAHYLAALGALGNGDMASAKGSLEKAIELNPNHLWARTLIEELQK